MTVYAMGDVQGCYDEMRYLLDRVDFDPAVDKLWLVGDLINRGRKNVQVLRFVKSLGKRAIVVLGNHDLHFLAVAHGIRRRGSRDTFKDIQEAPDRGELIDWLRTRPLLHHDARLGYIMVHAGILPNWSLKKARSLAKEAQKKLAGEDYLLYLTHIYGDAPNRWNDELEGFERFRVIINAFTRLRYCKPNGTMEFAHRANVVPRGFLPWFKHPRPKHAGTRILFGHWASLNGKTGIDDVIGLDTGCVWGRELTIMRLKSGKRITCTREEAQRALAN